MLVKVILGTFVTYFYTLFIHGFTPMKSPSVKNVLRRKFAGDTHGYICLQVGIPGAKKSLPKSYGIKILATQWDEETEMVKKSHPDYNQINAQILAEKQRVLDAFKADGKRGVALSEVYVKDKINPAKATGNFMQFYSEYVDLVDSRHSPGYAKHILTEYNSLKDFAGLNIDFADITAEFLERYEKSLKVEGTTLHTKMKRLKAVVDKAVDRGRIFKPSISGYKLPRYEEPEAKYLTLEQTEKIAQKVYNGDFDNDETMHKIASFFIIECYSGIRFSDWGRFKIETLIDKRNFRVRTQKNKQPVYLPLDSFVKLGKMVDYIATKGFVFDLTEQATNRLLKVLGSTIGVSDLTTHVGRHTCGTLLGMMGYSTRAIADVLGITEKTAKRYVQSTRQGLINEVQKHGGL